MILYVIICYYRILYGCIPDPQLQLRLKGRSPGPGWLLGPFITREAAKVRLGHVPCRGRRGTVCGSEI